MLDFIASWFTFIGLDIGIATFIARGILSALVILLALFSHFFIGDVIFKLVRKAVEKTKNTYDDIIINKGVLKRFALLAPIIVLYIGVDFIFLDEPVFLVFLKKIFLCAIVLASLRGVDAALDALTEVYRKFELSKKTPIKGYIQVIKIFMYIVGAVFIISILLNQSPWEILGGIGAMTAVILLVFKDSILGLVASVQMNANNMIRMGDWVEMPKYNADGDVIDITLNTIKIQNWDKTITTIPTYAFIADSFRNWRGMQESGGRRIKRSLYIDVSSIKFVDAPMMEAFKKIRLLQDYLKEKEEELEAHNGGLDLTPDDLVNGRHLTNIGTFRAYAEKYLRNNPKIHKEMTLLVRQKQPTENGLPIEFYTFTNDVVWAHYEAIQADIFDHMLAVLPTFGLKIFQTPSGMDVQELQLK